MLTTQESILDYRPIVPTVGCDRPTSSRYAGCSREWATARERHSHTSYYNVLGRLSHKERIGHCLVGHFWNRKEGR